MLTDLQILTLTIAVVLPALGVMGTVAALMSTNKRVDDVKTEITAMEKRLTQHIDNAFTHMELLLKLHEAEHHKK